MEDSPKDMLSCSTSYLREASLFKRRSISERRGQTFLAKGHSPCSKAGNAVRHSGQQMVAGARERILPGAPGTAIADPGRVLLHRPIWLPSQRGNGALSEAAGLADRY